MQIICETQVLNEFVSIVSKAVSGRSTVPILECVLLVSDENGFRMIGNDMELGIETVPIPATVNEHGSVALDAKMLMDIIRRLPGESVTIQTDAKDSTTITSGRAKFTIMGQPGSEFPFPPTLEHDAPCRIHASELKNMIRRTLFSVSLDDAKPALTGELMDIKDNVVKLVSVDGFRISLNMEELEVVDGVDTGVQELRAIIPAKTLSELGKVLPADGDSMVDINTTERHIMFTMEQCKVVSRVIEGDFINYDSIFTDEYTTMMKADRSVLIDSLERASLISKDARKNPVRLEISENEVVVTSKTEQGNMFDAFPIQQEGQDLMISFNPRFLIDALKALEDEEVELQLTTPLSPCIVKGTDNDKHKYLVLPLRTRE